MGKSAQRLGEKFVQVVYFSKFLPLAFVNGRLEKKTAQSGLLNYALANVN